MAAKSKKSKKKKYSKKKSTATATNRKTTNSPVVKKTTTVKKSSNTTKKKNDNKTSTKKTDAKKAITKSDTKKNNSIDKVLPQKNSLKNPKPKKQTSKKNTAPSKKTTNKYKKKKHINIIQIPILLLLYICKGFLISVKFIKNLLIKQYNVIRRRRKSKKAVNAIRRREIEANELVLKRYRDNSIILFPIIFIINRIRVIRFDMRNFKKKFKYGTLKDKLLIIFMILLILGFSAVIAFCVYIIATAPEVSEENLYKNTTSVLLDSEGKEYARIGIENRENVTYEDLPEVLIDAIVATEDSRFFQHNGIDIARFTKATIGQLMGRSDAGGGSTLTMQVSKKAATSTESHGIKGIIRKFTDIYLSVFVFEQRYTKEQIMEFYVNLNFLGARSYGVEQASQTYFGKSVSELNLVEAALIAGLFQAPDYLNPYNNPEGAENRRNTVLNLMYRHGYISEEERDIAQSVPVSTMLKQHEQGLNESEYIGFIDTLVQEVKDKTGMNPYDTSMTIYTTLNRAKQDVINEMYSTFKFQDDFVELGVAVVDVDTGAIIGVGAGRNKKGAGSWNFAKTRRHPGSVAKPVIDYGPAIEYLGWGTGNTLIDDEYTYTGGGKIKNFDNKYKGILTVKKALAQSRNIPALFTFQQTTNEQKLDFAKSLGWTPETTPNGTLLESDSIGGFKGVTPLEAAAAYATFARGGVYIEPYSYTRIEFPDNDDVIEQTIIKRQVMGEDTAFLITKILQYAVSSGTVVAGKPTGTEVAGKTGTSTVSDSALKALGLKGNIVGDSWEVTYTQDYSIAIWQGYEPQLTKEHYLLNKYAIQTRNGVSKYLDNKIFEKNSKFKKPNSVVSAEIELETDPIQLASEFTPSELKSTEWFKEDSVPKEVSTRFSRLDNPLNVRYTSTSYSVTLSWDAIPTPDAVNYTSLQTYFNESTIYKNWAEKYLNKRIEYNNKNIGAFGYEVYLVNSSGTYDLGFTTNTYFTANVQFDESTKFVVKSSYQKFKSNQSTGVYVTVAPNSESTYTPPETTTTKSTTEPIQMRIIYKGQASCSTLSDYKLLGNAISDKFKVEANGVDVTNQSNISINCYLDDDDNDLGGHCSSMTSDQTYRIEITAVYKNIRRISTVTIKPSC